MAQVGQRRAVGAALSSRQLRDSSTSKQKPEGEERTPADVQINGRRSTSRRWVDRNKKPSMWARPPSVGEVKVVPAYEHVLLEDCEDATDFVDSDETPDAVARRERALAVLHKPRGARSADEVDFLCSLLAGVHFFEKRNPEERHEIARGLALRRVEAHEKVFTIRSSASTFYVILQGAARAYIPIEATDFAVPTEDESASSGVFNSHVLEDGDSFGEKGLLLDAYGKMQPRNVEVIAAVPSLLLCLSRADYEESLQTLRDRRALKHARMLRNVFVFRDWSDEDLQRLGAVVTERRFEKGVAILKQGSRLGDSMFFLIEGECRELQLMEVSDAQRQMLEVNTFKAGHSKPFFGEAAMAERRAPDYSSSIVSDTPVVCLGLSKYDFVHHIDEGTQKLILGFNSVYGMDDKAIRSSISKNYEWQVQKKEEVRATLAVSAERRRLESPRQVEKQSFPPSGDLGLSARSPMSFQTERLGGPPSSRQAPLRVAPLGFALAAPPAR